VKTSSAPSRGAIVLAFATIYLVWGSTYLGIRVAVETMPPFLMAGARFTISGVLLFSFMLAKGAKWPTPRQWLDQAIAGTFLLLGGNAVVSWCELRTPSGITSLVLGAAPVFVVLLDWLRPGGSRPTLGIVVGVAVGIGGIALLFGPDAIPASAKPPAIDIIALFLSSLSWWIGSFYSRHAKSGGLLLMNVSIQMLCGSFCIILTGLLLGEGSTLHLASITTQSWLAFAYLVIVGSIIAFTVYAWLLHNSSPSKVSTFAYVNPVVAVFLGWLILGEPMNSRIILATAITIGAVAIITVQRTRNASKA
jgi:drug/metabolite transporter (DMT)-like permease